MMLDTRTRALDVLKSAPGSSTRGIARALSMDESTADYHLRRLEKLGLATRERAGREIAWFARGCGFCPVLRRAVPILRREESLGIARALDDRPRPHAEVAARARVPVGSARWVVPLLVEAGIAEKTRGGRARLRDEARLCVEKAAASERCGQWGVCAVSRALGAEPPRRTS